MAYMNQEKKAIIHTALKEVLPSGWKYGLSVGSKTTIVLTIWAAPIDLLGHVRSALNSVIPAVLTHWKVDTPTLDYQFTGSVLQDMENILAALNTGNGDWAGHPDSDCHYVEIWLGDRSNPFIDIVPAPPKQKYSKSGYQIA